MRNFLMISAAALILTACSNGEADKVKADATKAAEATQTETKGKKAKKQTAAGSDTKKAKAKSPKTKGKFNAAKLDTILAAQSEKAQARYGARRPAKTLKFFGIKPGMAVGEALPGGGWYTKILVPYLGEEGELIGIDYSLDMWPEFSFANEAFIENKKNWPTEFVTKAAEWAPADGAKISAMTFGDAAGDRAGTLDAVLFTRALHNLSRYETEGQYMTKALSKTHDLLKPGGIVGVVQHRAPETADDDWANGSAGYMKQSKVIAAFDAAGFDLVQKSGLNANPKDKPTSEDVVWRLPPSLSGVGDNETLKAERMAIGESSRMTLLFKKR